MANQIKLPNLGENIESGDVLSILVSEGDTVKKNQDLLEVETDKATMPVPSPQAGKIIKILDRRRRHGEGRRGDHGDRSRRRSENGAAKTEEKPAAKKAEPKKEEPSRQPPKPAKKKEPEPEPEADEEEADEPEPAPKKAPPKKAAAAAPKIKVAAPRGGRSRATARRSPRPAPPCAASPGNWASICAACGPPATAAASRPKTCRPSSARRTSKWPPARRAASRRRASPTSDDLRRRARREDVADAADDRPQHGPVVHDDPAAHELRRRRRHRARRHARAEQGRLRRPRHQAHDDAVSDQGGRLVAAKAPVVNASVDMENHQIIYKEYVNIGIAVDTERGLVVPVLRDADRKSISQIAAELERIADMARDGEFDARRHEGRHVHDQQPGRDRRHVFDADHQPAAKWRSCWSAAARIVPQMIDDAVEAAADDAALDHLRPPRGRRRRGGAVPERSEGLSCRRRGGCCSRRDPNPRVRASL